LHGPYDQRCDSVNDQGERAPGQFLVRRRRPSWANFTTAAAVAACILRGAHIVRVHDVRAMRAAADVADEILLTREG